MAEDSPLSPDGNLTEYEHEQLIGRLTPSGLVGHPNDTAPVSVSGSQLFVRADLRAVMRGFPWWSGPDPLPFSPSLAGPARTDLLVLRLDRADGHRVKASLRTGTAGNPAPAPAAGLGPAVPWEIPLAEADISGGAITALRQRAWFVGEDGVYLCKPSTRPPHAPGRRIREVDTGRAYESTGSKWAVLLDDSGAVEMTMRPGYAATHRDCYRRDGMAFAELTFSRSASMSGSTALHVATLPAGMAPAVLYQTFAMCPSLQSVHTCAVWPDGKVFFNPSGVTITAGRSIVFVPMTHPVGV